VRGYNISGMRFVKPDISLPMYGAVMALCCTVMATGRALPASSTVLADSGALGATVSTPASREYIYPDAGPVNIMKNLPGDVAEFGRRTFCRENIPVLAGITVSTALLIASDSYTFEKTWEMGDRMGIAHLERKSTIVRVHVPVLNRDVGLLALPNSLGTAMYFLGDGWMHMSITGAFFGYGYLASDIRALKTAADLLETLTLNGTTVLAIKMSTGRENPVDRSTPTGKWRFFTNPVTYLGHVTKYDAYPSGHVASVTGTVTVIAENYPEYRWIQPVGYAMLVPLGFQMVNGGIHWYSDYPLSLFIGYTYAKIVLGRRRIVRAGETVLLPDVRPIPLAGGAGLELCWNM